MTRNAVDDGYMARLAQARASGAPLFRLGQTVATPGALGLSGAAIHRALARHQSGDWGDLDPEDKAANDLAIKDGTRLLSAYYDGPVKFWVITEADRSVTTVLLPEEY